MPFVTSIERRGQRRGEAIGEARGEAIGVAKGEAKGVAKGEAKGRAQAVLRIARKRFQLLPRDLEVNIQNLDSDALDELIDSLLDVSSISELQEHVSRLQPTED